MLLQEGILATRIRPLVSPALQPVQGGYIRNSLDTVLYLHELSVHYVACGRCLLAIHGDLIHAFPRTWREELFVLLHYVVGIRDGALAEVASILEWDEWLVPLSGASWKSITQGLPEGGVLGPLLFNLLPDTLAIALRDAGCGVARDARVPPIWQQHIWSGAGIPQPSLVQLALDGLRGLGPLPSAAELAYHPDIEASAARALDLFDAHRSAVRFHADDPVFLASSYGAAQEVLRVVADWASVHKAAFHIAQRKTVATVFGAAATVAAMMAGPKLYFPEAGYGGAFTITWVQRHKWLGMLWRNDLDWLPFALSRVGAASSCLSSLVGLVYARAIPLTMALELFNAKVLGTIAYGRWLWNVFPQCQEFLESSSQRWARTLLGSPPWRSHAAAYAELGWTMSGAALAIRDAARKRAKLWRLPPADTIRQAFPQAHSTSTCTWASVSLVLLSHWGVPDWPDAADSCQSLQSYFDLVDKILRARSLEQWLSDVRPHVAPVDYRLVMSVPCTHLRDAWKFGHPWEVLVGQRSLSRLRAGLLRLGHRGGRKSSARVQHCIGCDGEIENLVWHMIFECEAVGTDARRELSEALQDSVISLSALDALSSLLSLSIDHAAFPALVSLSTRIERTSEHFWRNHGKHHLI